MSKTDLLHITAPVERFRSTAALCAGQDEGHGIVGVGHAIRTGRLIKRAGIALCAEGVGIAATYGGCRLR